MVSAENFLHFPSVVCPLLIGRELQLEALKTLQSRAEAGEGQVVLISSEAGVGKTRFVKELSQQAMQAGFDVHVGECFEQQQNLPYSLLVDLLLHYQQFMDIPTTIDRSFPDLAGLLLALQAPQIMNGDLSAVDSEQERQRLFFSLDGLLAARLDSRPLLLIAEDIHWSDAASLEFLLYWVRRTRNRPVLQVLTFRQEEGSEPLRRFLVEINRSRRSHVLQLEPLTPNEVERMLRVIFGQEKPVSAEFVQLIHQLTEGNPFYIEEVLKSLLNNGEISVRNGIWERHSMAVLRVPTSLRDSIRLRLDRLERSSQDLLKLAAVVGRRFYHHLLQELTGQHEMELLAQLRQLVDSQLVIEEQGGEFSFRHALTREAVYLSLLELERRHFHELIAGTIERLHTQELSEYAASLSYHHFQAGNWLKVCQYAKLAGEKAMQLHAPREALVEYSRLIEATGRLNLPLSAAQYRQRGKAYEVLGDFERARLDYERALELAEQDGDPVSTWECLAGLGFLWLEKDYSLAGSYFQQALTLAGSLEDPALLAATYNHLGNWYLNQEMPDQAIQYHQQALAIYTTSSDLHGQAATLDLIGVVYSMGSSFLDSYTYYGKAVALFQQIGDRRGLSSSLAVMAENSPTFLIDSASLYANPIPHAISFGEQSLSIAQEIGWQAGISYAQSVLGICSASFGEFARAFEHLRLAQEIAEEIDHLQWLALSHLVRGAVYLELFAFSESRFELERSYELAVQINSPFWMRYVSGFLSFVYVSEGRLGEAARIVDEALHADDSLTTLSQRLCWVARLSIALEKKVSTQAIDIAERLLQQVQQVETHPVFPWQVPPRLLMLYGEALMLAKRFDEAEVQFTAALASAATGEARSLTWRIHCHLGQCLRFQRRFEQADREFSSGHYLLAELSNSIPGPGMRQNFIDHASSFFPIPPARDPIRHEKRLYGGLTRREREIAWYVSQGYSNRGIAEQLYLSERTVERHITHILDKLAFASRAQIISWALQVDLTRPGN